MQCAVYSGSVKVTRYMVKKGVNPNVKNGEGRTALQLAIKNGSEAMVALLKECRTQVLADAEITQENLINACAKGDLVVAKKCLAQGARVNETDGAGRTALTAAVGMKRNYNMVKFLLAVGANPNLKSEAGLASTPLNTAIGPSENPGVKPIVILLLKAGAQISAPDDTYGMTPLHFAALFQNVAVAKILLEAGANVTLKDKKGKTPLDYAESSEMIKLLTASGAKE
jgi:ankyrin repeat protein